MNFILLLINLTLGSNDNEPVDVRIITSPKSNMGIEYTGGKFRPTNNPTLLSMRRQKEYYTLSLQNNKYLSGNQKNYLRISDKRLHTSNDESLWKVSYLVDYSNLNGAHYYQFENNSLCLEKSGDKIIARSCDYKNENQMFNISIPGYKKMRKEKISKFMGGIVDLYLQENPEKTVINKPKVGDMYEILIERATSVETKFVEMKEMKPSTAEKENVEPILIKQKTTTLPEREIKPTKKRYQPENDMESSYTDTNEDGKNMKPTKKQNRRRAMNDSDSDEYSKIMAAKHAKPNIDTKGYYKPSYKHDIDQDPMRDNNAGNVGSDAMRNANKLNSKYDMDQDSIQDNNSGYEKLNTKRNASKPNSKYDMDQDLIQDNNSGHEKLNTKRNASKPNSKYDMDQDSIQDSNAGHTRSDATRNANKPNSKYDIDQDSIRDSNTDHRKQNTERNTSKDGSNHDRYQDKDSIRGSNTDNRKSGAKLSIRNKGSRENYDSSEMTQDLGQSAREYIKKDEINENIRQNKNNYNIQGRSNMIPRDTSMNFNEDDKSLRSQGIHSNKYNRDTLNMSQRSANKIDNRAQVDEVTELLQGFKSDELGTKRNVNSGNTDLIDESNVVKYEGSKNINGMMDHKVMNSNQNMNIGSREVLMQDMLSGDNTSKQGNIMGNVRFYPTAPRMISTKIENNIPERDVNTSGYNTSQIVETTQIYKAVPIGQFTQSNSQNFVRSQNMNVIGAQNYQQY